MKNKYETNDEKQISLCEKGREKEIERESFFLF